MGSREYQLLLGETVLDLRYNLPFAARERTRTGSCLMVADVLVDGWRSSGCTSIAR